MELSLGLWQLIGLDTSTDASSQRDMHSQHVDSRNPAAPIPAAADESTIFTTKRAKAKSKRGGVWGPLSALQMAFAFLFAFIIRRFHEG